MIPLLEIDADSHCRYENTKRRSPHPVLVLRVSVFWIEPAIKLGAPNSRPE
jgi:hypothetical protein